MPERGTPPTASADPAGLPPQPLPGARPPETFDPDRWKPAERGPEVPVTVFGGGARKCIGDQFALVAVTARRGDDDRRQRTSQSRVP
ncbi:cytochrome P450 [Streptomyces sp. FXJ1.4098]|uniref:cytochrome P450 n=1 Tax=Streptomyces sp. NPDC020845 TaxID=3365096 RepID=UPI002993EA7A|nr:cytochrome P450 [Streptomyces sp. FXJ1.4098]